MQYQYYPSSYDQKHKLLLFYNSNKNSRNNMNNNIDIISNIFHHIFDISYSCNQNYNYSSYDTHQDIDNMSDTLSVNTQPSVHETNKINEIEDIDKYIKIIISKIKDNQININHNQIKIIEDIEKEIMQSNQSINIQEILNNS